MINKEDIQHTAELARIELTKEEEERLEHDLSSILEFVGQLGRVDTAAIEPATGGTALKNVLRADAPYDPALGADVDELARAAHAKSGEHVRVQKIFL